MHFEGFPFGSIRIDGVTYNHGCVANSRMRMNVYIFWSVRLGRKTEGDADEPDLFVDIALL